MEGIKASDDSGVGIKQGGAEKGNTGEGKDGVWSEARSRENFVMMGTRRCVCARSSLGGADEGASRAILGFSIRIAALQDRVDNLVIITKIDNGFLAS